MNSENSVRPVGLLRLLIAQTQVVFNDNAAKLVLIGLANLVLPAENVGSMTGILAVLLVLPFVLFSPVCGWLADRFPKTRVLRDALVLQLIVTVVVALALFFHQFALASACFFFMALQSAIFSPAKQGILKDLAGPARLNQAVSWVEASTIVAILGGSYGGGLLLDYLTQTTGNAWTGATGAMAVLALSCMGALLVFRKMPVHAAESNEPFRLSLFWEHFGFVQRLWRQRPLFGAALGVAWFYGFGGLFYLILVQVGREVHPGVGAASLTGWLFALLGVGIIAGSILYARLSQGRISVRSIPLSATGMALSLLLLALVPINSLWFQAGLVTLGLAAGAFVVPLNAFLQDRALNSERGQMLAAGNLLGNVTGMIAVAAQLGMAHVGFSTTHQVLICAGLSAVVALVVMALQPEGVIRFLGLAVTRIFYRVRIEGAQHLPKTGGVLLVSNHVSYVDALLLGLYAGRPVRFIAFAELFRVPILGHILQSTRSIPISAQRSKEAMRLAVEQLRAGEVVCIFPEGELTRTGEVMGFKRGFELMARKAEVPVVPVHLDSLWGSIFSFAGGRYFWKVPPELPRPIKISFGAALPPQTVEAEEARRQILELGEKAFRERPELSRSLGWSVVQRLASAPGKVLVLDAKQGLQPMRAGELLAVGIVLATRWRQSLRGSRIGIALPPGRGAFVANLAVTLAGKIPVNLNLTTTRESAESSLRRAEIETVVSAAAVQSAFPQYPWPPSTLDLTKELAALPRWKIGLALSAVWTLPGSLLAAWCRLKKEGGEAEAVLLFTSGSSGDPKGVALSHRNILANVAQVTATDLLKPQDRLLGCLPLFHSFGSTFTLWLPLLRGIMVVTTPSPTDAARIAEVVSLGAVTILPSTPTFLRNYARKFKSEQLGSVRLIVAGAEKLPEDVATLYRERYRLEIMEGYGLTETSPTLSVNVPHPAQGPGATSEQTGNRSGSVGRLLPGLAYRLIGVESGTAVKSGEIGLLQVKGANVFQGYLHDAAKSTEVLRDGWFTTGDLARLDEEGFLFIEGRLSRFAKIGGEMVPLAKLEEIILRENILPQAHVVAVPHPTKGESLVLLTTQAVELEQLRQRLQELAVPNLWHPRAVRVLSEIPVLATGKVDLRACRALAEQS